MPFYAGTYFPPDQRMGMPAWRQVLEAVAHGWQEKKDEIRAGGERVAERLRGGALLRPSSEPIDPRALDDAVSALSAQYDVRTAASAARRSSRPPRPSSSCCAAARRT